jgi:probable HAF family extracellular repeat protein
MPATAAPGARGRLARPTSPSPWRPGRRRGGGRLAHGGHRRGRAGPDAGAGRRADPAGPRPRRRQPDPRFLLDRGRYATIEAPNPDVRLFPFDINNRGQLTGEYIRVGPDGMWDRGRVTTIEIPGADPVRTEPIGVNNRGQVVGPYLDRNGTLHGFVWDKGRLTTIDVPGATSTSPTAVNDRGQVLGVYTDAAGTFHGFVLRRGRLVSFDAPDQGDFLLPLDINNRGQIVGYTVDDPVTLAGARGFLLAKGARGPVTTISFPGAPRTIATGINDQGQIVGFYENPNAPPSRPAAARLPTPGRR